MHAHVAKTDILLSVFSSTSTLYSFCCLVNPLVLKGIFLGGGRVGFGGLVEEIGDLNEGNNVEESAH